MAAFGNDFGAEVTDYYENTLINPTRYYVFEDRDSDGNRTVTYIDNESDTRESFSLREAIAQN